jgi:hypothetical protein
MIMEADTIIHPKEIEYMDAVLINFAITADDNEHMDNMDMQMCLSIIKNMSLEKQEIAKEMFIRMTEADGFVDSREKQILELYSI